MHTGTGTLAASGEDPHGGTIPMPTFARRPSTISSLFPVGIPQNSIVGQERQHISELQFEQIPCTFYILMIFHRRLCYGSKKWRWSIHWMN